MPNSSQLYSIFVKWFILLHINIHFRCTDAAIEEIEATPTNTNAFELGDISMPQFIAFCIIFLIIVLLYGYGVVPIEVDLGYFYGTGSGELIPRKLNNEVDFTKLLFNCPLQYVCDVDMWANRDDHELFAEKLIASWFKNPNSTFSGPKSKAFGGTGSCMEMYPCPFDVQDLVGIHIPGSRKPLLQYTNKEADIYMDLTT